MSKITLIVVAIFAALVSRIDAECANACNGHGKCVGYDMCICNRNWQANDCSERVCMHGLAHVDTPKGDLDMSGSIAKPSVAVVVDNSFQYPYGTTEQFPAMEDSDLNILPQSAHYYMECSNKGTCDRATGLCECFDGYDGVACQRASCPGYPASCSGHGVCKTASQLAGSDAGNVYKLWNKDTTMGCECDAGYFGPDCSERRCKVGVDPLYLDDSSTVKYSIFDFATLTTAGTADFDDGHPQQGTGYWAIRFFDHSGEDWVTEKIAAGADCATVKKALYGIPNDVIPAGTLYCTKTSQNAARDDSGAAGTGWNDGVEDKTGAGDDVDRSIHGVNYKINYQMSIWDAYVYGSKSNSYHSDILSAETDLGNSIYGPTLWIPGSYLTSVTRKSLSGHIYRIKFLGNPGKLREPEIVTHLDGKRNSLMSTTFSGSSAVPATAAAVITKVWTDGQQGEDKDYFADHCDGVTVGIHTDDLTADAGVNKKTNQITTTSKFFHIVPGRLTYDSTAGTTAWTARGELAQFNLLKKCLGDSDATSTNNVEIYDWDHGTEDYPHLIKLVRSVTSATDGGYYAAVIFKTHNNGFVATGGVAADRFVLLNPFVPPDALQGDTYEVYTTKGTLSRVSRQAVAHFGFAQNKVITTHIQKTASGNAAKWDGDLSCEVGANNDFRVSPSIFIQLPEGKKDDGTDNAEMAPSSILHNGNSADVFINDVVTEWTYDYTSGATRRTASKHYKNCLNKTDIITFLNPTKPEQNPQHLNLYTIERLVKDLAVHSNIVKFPEVAVTATVGSVGNDGIVGAAPTFTPMKYGTNVITLDMSTNWGTDLGENAGTLTSVMDRTYVYKFVPAAASTYEYVAECSNRGLCDRDTGTCTCFAGYTSDNCHEQSSLAL